MPFRSLLWSCALFTVGLAGAAPAGVGSLAERLADTRMGSTVIDAIYRDAIIEHGTIDQTVERLEAHAADTGRPAAFRGRALLVASHLQWRFGRLADATETIARALTLERSGATLLHHAYLREATHDLPAARAAYEEALTHLDETYGRTVEDVQLRLVFLETDTRNVTALVAYARTRDEAFRNRAAVALAILNRPAEATSLYTVFGEGTDRQRRHLRLAQWALRAGQVQRAQEEAWQAVQAASLSRDVRYSLSLLMEAHELDGSWERLLARFEGQYNLGSDVESVRVEVLRRLKRYDEAIALAERGRKEGMSAENQRRLLRMYGEAGRKEALVVEYRNLIAADPGGVAWWRDLSEYFVEQGGRADAEALWREFLERNTSPDVLLEGGQAMGKLGFETLALAAADRSLALHPGRAVQVAWYRFEHYLARGQMADAEMLLAGLDRDLPAAAPERGDLADAYERIKLPARSVAVWEQLQKARGGLSVDEQMRLAWLYDSTGRRDRAFAVWKHLWDDEVPAARRRLVEDRLLLLAAEIGELGGIAIELEQRLAQGAAAPKDSSLLIRIYTELGDPASAIEVIQEYHARREPSPEAEIERLREQARVFQLLNRQNAFAAVTDRLLSLDPGNRADYLQSLILGHLERNTPQDRVQLERRLAELRASEAAADDEFEAGVLVMAGMRDRAIASYRLALAKNPAQGDNYLLLSDLLNQDRRSGEATAILQYFAETAAGDDGFMVAIDGILNAKPAADSPVLAWARRRVLERITQRDDRFYLYDLSAELAQEARDAPAYLASLENALVEAGPRRSSVLRELLAATEDNSAGAVSARGVSQADLKLNAAYGRRLIALGEEMPPDVYLNVGRTFLRMGNPAEALDAFNLAIDRLNRPELIEESADRFDASGYSQQAASLYEKALIGDPENVGAMSKLAAVRSRLGAVKLARELYLRALLKLANQQLVEVASSGQARAGNVAADERFSFPFRRYFGALQTSLVFNWEAGDARAASNTVLSAIEEAQALALKDVVERIGGRTSPAINQFPRLDALTGLLRTLALLTGRYEVADRADIRLLANFGRDTTLVAGLVQERLAWGLRPSALRLLQAEGVAAGARANLTATITRGGNLEPYVDLVAAARQALDEGSYANAVELALDAGDNALVLTAYRQWIAAHSSTPTAAARQPVTVTNARNAPQTDVGDGQLTRIATHARGRLSAADFVSVCQQIVGVVTGDPGVARSVLMVATERGLPAVARRRSVLFDLENAVGRRLFNATELSKAIAQIDPRQLLSLDLEYVMAGLPADERLALFLRGLEASPPGISAIVLRALGGLLVEPLDDSAAQRVSAVLHGRLRDQSKSQLGLRSLQYLMRASLLTTKIHPRNAAFLAALDQHLVATYPDAPGGAGIFTQVLSPRDSYEAADAARLLDGAFEAYAAVNQRSASAGVPFGLTYFFSNYQGMLSDAAQDAMEDLLNRKVRDEGLTPANFWVTVALLRATPVGVGNKELAWLERTHRERPDHPLVLEALASGYRQRGEIERERQVLDQLLVIMPASEENRRRLAAIWRERDHPEQALAALDGRTAPPTSEASTSSRSGSMETRYPQIATLLAQWSSPGSPQSMADALRGVLQMLPPPGGRSVNYFQQVQSGIPSIPFSVFFGLNLPASTKSDQVGPAAGDATVPMLRWIQGDERVAGEPGQPVALLEGLQTEPFALAPIEAAVRALDPSVVENDSQYRLYASLASMWQLHGRADAEFSRLTEAMRKGEAGKKELLLWMELAVRQPESVVRELTATAEQRLMAAGPLTAYQRIQLARLYARAGLREKAVGAYAVAVTAAALSTTARVVQIGGTSLFSAGGLVADAAKHLDGAGMQLLVTHFLRRAQSADDLGQRQTHQRFLLDLAERAMRTGTPPLAVRPIVESFGMELAAREDLIRLSGLFARLGEVEKGLEALRRALVSRHDPLDRLPGAVRRYFVQEQLPSEIAALMELKTIFPATRKAWANDAGLMWVNRVAAVVPMWLAEPGNAIEPNTGLNLLALLTLRQHQLGQPATKGSAALLASLVQKQGRFSVRTATLAAAVARSVQTPFGAPPLRQLIGDRNLDVSLLASAVRDVAQTEGAKVAFELGESALAYTRNDALLKELESLAGQLGDASRQHELSTMRGAAVRARLLLERGPAES